MAHFAEINSDNEVVRIVVVHNNELLDENGDEQESLGVTFLHNFYNDNTINWKQTSFNGTFRQRYAYLDDGNGPGTYDAVNDVFIDPKPHASWTLDSNFAWEAPIAYPTVTTFTDTPNEFNSEGVYDYQINWDEAAYQADNTKGWTALDHSNNSFEWNTSTLAWDAV